MLLLAGAFLLVLGLGSGAILLAAPFGLLSMGPTATLWVLFPVLCLLGYSMFVVQANASLVRVFSLVASGLLLLMALIAVAALVLGAASVVTPQASTASLWFVLAVGIVFGSAGAAAFGRGDADGRGAA